MSKSINVPKLRFKEFNGEWEEKQLGKIATFYNSKRIPLTEIDRIKGEYPYYGASGIIDYVKDYIFDGEYILLGEDGANIVMRNSRLAFLAKGKFWVNNHAHIFQAKDSNTFLCEALERINYTKYNTGTAQPKLNSDVVKKIKLLVPLKQEQEKIASFLTSVDTKIEQLTKKEELLQQYKKGVMQKIFNQEIRFKADDGSEFCEWEENKLGDIGITYNGLTGKTSENFGSGKPYIQYKQIFDNSRITIDGFGYVSIEPNEKQNKVQFGDIFFTTSSETPNEVGFTSVLLDNVEEVYLNSFCFGYRAKSLDILNPYFAKFLFRSDNFRRKVIELAQGSTRYNISKLELMKTLIQLPCLEEQTKIANFLSAIDSKIEKVQKQLNSIKEFKKALLQQMFV